MNPSGDFVGKKTVVEHMRETGETVLTELVGSEANWETKFRILSEGSQIREPRE